MSLLTWTLGGLGIALCAVETFTLDQSDVVPGLSLAVVGVIALHGVRRMRRSAGQPHFGRRAVNALYLKETR